ncbi:hypothetical protein [Bacillus sp. USDA818B3_A]|uniref:hypothetical protein n=1 Tax=Bacillus sp. USDA818B3_A TaxID=2698834 RepID=UPI001368DAAD|nr:hypothetical protein [Bacillus sp. USDA818B3_A]
MDYIDTFLKSKNWLDTDFDSRYINVNHPYAILVSEDEGQITLRGNAGIDNGQNGEEIFTFTSLQELQEWFENNIGE